MTSGKSRTRGQQGLVQGRDQHLAGERAEEGMDLPEAAGPGDGVGDVVPARPDTTAGRAGCTGRRRAAQAGVPGQVGGDARAWWMLSITQITTIAGAARERLDEHASNAMKSAAQRRPSRRADDRWSPRRAEHGDLPVAARGRDLRAGTAQRPAGPPCGSRYRWVSSSASTTARRGSSTAGRDASHHVVVIGVAAGGQQAAARSPPAAPAGTSARERPAAAQVPRRSAAATTGPDPSSAAIRWPAAGHPAVADRTEAGRPARLSRAVEPADAAAQVAGWHPAAGSEPLRTPAATAAPSSRAMPAATGPEDRLECQSPRLGLWRTRKRGEY